MSLTTINPTQFRVTRPDGSRCYRVDGLDYPSVTTIIGEVLGRAKFKPRKPKEGVLDPMYRGTIIHAMVESFLLYGDFSQAFTKAETVGVTQDEVIAVLPYWKPLAKYLSTWIDEVKLLEFMVYSTKHKYAGTADALLVDKSGRLLLVDWKTTDFNVCYKQTFNHKYFLQATAYAMAITELYGVKIDKLHLVFATPGLKTASVYELDTQEYVAEWLDILDKYGM